MGKRKDDRQKNPAAVALGSIKSAKKAAASRANGMLGGRPKKQKEREPGPYRWNEPLYTTR